MIQLFLILMEMFGLIQMLQTLLQLLVQVIFYVGLISGLVAQKMKLNLSVLAAVCIQNDLSNRKNNVVVEDFLADIPSVMSTIKNNN